MKKLSILILFLFSLTLIPLSVGAAQNKGDCGDSAKWELSNSGVLTISGTGAIRDYIYEGASLWPNIKAPWRDQAEKITKIVIESGITRIGDNAFCCLPNVTSVSIPNTVTSIGQAAFCDDKNLNNVVFPNSVTDMETGILKRCSALTNVVLPNNLSVLPGSIFSECKALESIMLPQTLTEIGGRAFEFCVKLKSIDIPKNVTLIGNKSFYACDALTSVIVPEKVTKIDLYAFESSGLSYIQLPDTLEFIGTYAFGYTKITDITIPGNVTEILNDAFGFTYMTSITFLGDAPKFYAQTFDNMKLPCTVYYPSDNATWTEDVRQNYGGEITWIPYTDHVHTWGSWSTVEKPTCTREGLKSHSCTLCGTALTAPVSKTDHQYTSVVTKPTCQADGYTTYTCKDCGYSYTGKKVAAGQHPYGKWVVTLAPTSTELGRKERTCTLCGHLDYALMATVDENSSTTEPSTVPSTEPVTTPVTEPSTPPDSQPTSSAVTEPTGTTSVPTPVPTQPVVSNPVPKKNDTALIIGIILAVVIISGSGVWFFLRKRK